MCVSAAGVGWSNSGFSGAEVTNKNNELEEDKYPGGELCQNYSEGFKPVWQGDRAHSSGVADEKVRAYTEMKALEQVLWAGQAGAGVGSNAGCLSDR